MPRIFSAPVAAKSVTAPYTTTPQDSVINVTGASGAITLYSAIGHSNKLQIKHTGTSLTQLYNFATVSGQTCNGLASGVYAMATNGETVTLIALNGNWVQLDHTTTTGWIDSGGLVLTSSGGGVSIGTTAVNKVRWRRFADTADIDVLVVRTGGGANGAGVYIFGVPANMQIDLTKVVGDTSGAVVTTNNPNNRTNVGFFNQFVPGSTVYVGGYAVVYNAAGVRCESNDQLAGSGSGCGTVQGGGQANIGQWGNFVLKYTVPIVGWQP